MLIIKLSASHRFTRIFIHIIVYHHLTLILSIGLAIAERLAKDGASVMISSRKQQNVDKAVNAMKAKGLSVSGIVCHAASKEHRTKMIEKASKNVKVSNISFNGSLSIVGFSVFIRNFQLPCVNDLIYLLTDRSRVWRH
jgi:hypothetical protein